MEDLHRIADKVFDEVDRLDQILVDLPEHGTVHLELAVSIAKTARRQLTLLIKALATERDNHATAQEAQANEH